MRFFFHIVNSSSAYRDEYGRLFSSPDQARGHAAVVAKVLAGEFDWDGWALQVVDEGGAEVARLPIPSATRAQ